MTTFISYSRDNSDFAVRLARDLKVAGFDIWLDQLDIRTGARWDDEVEKALEKSTTFLIVLTPESIQSQNVKDEIGYAVDAGKHILPIILTPCNVPFRLRRFQYVDFSNKPYEDSLAEIKSLLSNTKELAKARGAGAERDAAGTGLSTKRPVAKEKSPPQHTRAQVQTPGSQKSRPLITSILVVVGVVGLIIVVLALRNPVLRPPTVTEPPVAEADNVSPATKTPVAIEPDSGPSATEPPVLNVIPPTIPPTFTPTNTKIPPTFTPTNTKTPLPSPDVALYSWWSSSRGDNFITTNPVWTTGINDIKQPDYTFVRIEGYVFSPDLPQPPNTVALYGWWSASREDNFATTQPAWAGRMGDVIDPDYTFARLEGYIYSPDLPQPPNTVPVYLWWSASRSDNFTTANPLWAGNEGDVMDPDYIFVRLDGYVREP